MAFLLITSSPGSNQTINLPVDWNPADNSVECIGAGARGAHGSSTTTGGGGGGGGAYTKIVNVSLTADTAVTVRIGATSGTDGGAGGDTWFNDTAFPTTGANKAGAKGGAALASATTTTGGIGGAGSSGYPTSGTGLVRNNGGNGGLGVLNTTPGGAGGAGGPGGAGVVGNAGNAGSNPRAGGAGNAGTGGAGGVGTNTASPGAAGGAGTYSGGGGGGSSATPSTGGAGGLYGGGGAGGGRTNGAGGAGAQGIIVLTWTPLIAGTLSLTEAADTISATGNVPLLSITGTLSLTEAADTIVAAGTVPSTGAATDYILRWNLASGTGTDLSGNSNDGVFNGGVTPITGGPIGNAAAFNGSTDYVSNDQVINQPYVSISLWIRTTAPDTYYHICAFGGVGSGEHDKEINLNPGGTISWYTYPGGTITSTTSFINDGMWHHIVCTVSNTVQCIYIDGVLDASGASTASYTGYSTPSPHLGGPAAGGYTYLPASYDDFRVYDRAVTASEAAALFAEGDLFSELPRYLVTNYFPGSDSNYYTGQLGVLFRARLALSYNRLGVRKGTGCTGYHTVNLYTYPGAVAALGTPLRTAEVDLTGGTVGNFYYADIAEITLTPDVDYFLVAEATASDGQFWSDAGRVALLGVTSGFTFAAFAAPDNLAQTRPDLPNRMFKGVDLALFEEAPSGDITGTLTITQAAQTLVSVGSVSVSGTLSRTEAADTITSTGTVVVTGTLGITEAADTISAAGTVGFPVITGTLTVTEAADTISAVGGPRVSGTLGITEAADTISAAGTVGVSGTLGITEAADTISAAGTVRVSGTLGVTEAADTISAAGVVGAAPAIGTLVLTEAPDTISAAGTVRVSGTLVVVEAADTLAATGGPIARGTLSLTEAADTIVAAGGPVARGTLSVTQANQTLAATAASAVGGVLNVTEAADILAAAGEVVAFNEVTGTLARVQADNTLVATGYRVFFSGVPGTVPITPGDRIVPTGQGERTIVSGATTRMLYASQDVRAVVGDAKPRLIMAASLRRVA